MTNAVNSAINKPLTDYVDDFAGLTRLHQRDLYTRSKEEVEAFRLALLRKRFSELVDRVGALRKLAEIQGVREINSLDDAAPILFQHTVYKSYPMPFLEKGRFDALTKWFSQLTAHDLSGVDATKCKFVDQWLTLLQEQTELKPIHTTGTSGKLSFLPRAKEDWKTQIRLTLTRWQGMPGERDISFDTSAPGFRLPIIQPGYRYGFYMAQRLMEEQIELIGDPDKVESLYNELLSPDVLSLGGRVATAQAKGELDKLVIDPALMQRFKESQEKAKNKAQMDAEFFDRVLERFSGQRVMIGNTVPQLYAWAAEGKRRGLKGIFAADSLIGSGGGLKGQPLPDDWKQQIEEVIGAPVQLAYGMSEICCMNNMCSHGNYHVPPALIVYVLDEHSGQPLPRKGEQTGRAALFDTLPDMYWGGFVTGDEITVNWDGNCACGRHGEYILPTIRRFSDKNGNDDKISCAGAPDAQEKAMEFLARQAEKA
ncbi:MAG: hypothetical protein ABW049_06680 [Spongiibacteraceae bacterium]